MSRVRTQAQSIAAKDLKRSYNAHRTALIQSLTARLAEAERQLGVYKAAVEEIAKYYPAKGLVKVYPMQAISKIHELAHAAIREAEQRGGDE